MRTSHKNIKGSTGVKENQLICEIESFERRLSLKFIKMKFLLGQVILILSVVFSVESQVQKRPHIIYILADDLVHKF